jgi:hypothetical protein
MLIPVQRGRLQLRALWLNRCFAPPQVLVQSYLPRPYGGKLQPREEATRGAGCAVRQHSFPPGLVVLPNQLDSPGVTEVVHPVVLAI